MGEFWEVLYPMSKSRSIPFRLTAENDSYVKQFMQDRQFSNRNLSINKIIEEHRTMIHKYRADAKEKILKLMRDYNFKPKELE
jgi:hypothetical protein